MANSMQKYIDMWKQYVEGIRRGDRKMSKNNMLILFLCGILLYIIWLPINDNSGYENEKVDNIGVSKDVTIKTDGNVSTYQDKLEAELAEFLEMVDGVGAVEVLIYLDSSEEYIVEKDTPIVDSASEESGADGAKSSKLETEIDETTVYTVNSNGDEVPFVSRTKNPAIAGIVIAAQGADNETVKLRIIKMTMALYGLEANKVEVLSMKK